MRKLATLHACHLLIDNTRLAHPCSLLPGPPPKWSFPIASQLASFEVLSFCHLAPNICTMSSNYALPPRPRTPSPASNTQKDLLIKDCNSAFKASRKFKISKPRKLATSKGDDFLTPLQFFFLNIMFLNKVSGYSREAAQGRSLGRATTWDLINQINNGASRGKQRTLTDPLAFLFFH